MRNLSRQGFKRREKYFKVWVGATTCAGDRVRLKFLSVD